MATKKQKTFVPLFTITPASAGNLMLHRGCEAGDSVAQEWRLPIVSMFFLGRHAWPFRLELSDGR